MTIRTCLLTVVLFLLSCQLYSQERNPPAKDMMFDVNGEPICVPDSINEQRVIKYFIPQIVSDKIEYKGGREGLQIFCDSLFYRHKDYDHTTYFGSILYTILFDSKLEIKDIRIINNVRDNYYDNMIIEILKQTKGNWQKTEEDNSKWLIYWGRYRLR